MIRLDPLPVLRGATTTAVCVLCLFFASPSLSAAELPASRDSARLEVESVGEQRILMPPGQNGLGYFPDESIPILRREPLSFLMVAGNVTWLMQGTSWAAAKPVRKVLEPSPGGPDNGYAGVSGVYLDAEKKTLYAFYHAEDHTGYDKLEYNSVPNFMASICLAVGPLSGERLEKRGQVLTTHQAKNPSAGRPQGVADATVSPSPDGHFLYAWYTDHSRVENRGVQICMARSPLVDRGSPGTWKKWYRGDFSEPGLGGRETPVVSLRDSGADAWAPNVVFVPECRQYLMAFNATVYADLQPAAAPKGGIRLAHSADGIHWSSPITLITAMGLPVPGRECAIHPTFVVTRASDKLIEGTLLYGYSPKWGHTTQEPSHHLASRMVRISVVSN